MGGGLFADDFNFLSSAIEVLLSVSISSEDISDDDVEDVEFLKQLWILVDNFKVCQCRKLVCSSTSLSRAAKIYDNTI